MPLLACVCPPFPGALQLAELLGSPALLDRICYDDGSSVHSAGRGRLLFGSGRAKRRAPRPDVPLSCRSYGRPKPGVLLLADSCPRGLVRVGDLFMRDGVVPNLTEQVENPLAGRLCHYYSDRGKEREQEIHFLLPPSRDRLESVLTVALDY